MSNTRILYNIANYSVNSNILSSIQFFQIIQREKKRNKKVGPKSQKAQKSSKSLKKGKPHEWSALAFLGNR
jgi:hypothetical protein